MSKDRFTIISTSAFERAARKLAGKVPHMDEWLSEADLILESYPFQSKSFTALMQVTASGDYVWASTVSATTFTKRRLF